MENVVRWYDRENWPYAVDRERLEQYATWLNLIPWAFFCTLTFAWGVSDRQAEKLFNEFIRRLETTLRCNVAYVRGDEKRLSGSGKSACPRHFHALFACTVPLTAGYLQDSWMAMAGNRSDGSGAEVKPYDPERNGVEYVLKFINKTEGEWDLRNLDLFLLSDTNVLNHAAKRRLQRHAKRQQFAPSVRDLPMPVTSNEKAQLEQSDGGTR
jgi:hypothetical protein